MKFQDPVIRQPGLDSTWGLDPKTPSIHGHKFHEVQGLTRMGVPSALQVFLVWLKQKPSAFFGFITLLYSPFQRPKLNRKTWPKCTWMCQEVSKRFVSVGYNPNLILYPIDFQVGYNPFTNRLQNS